MDTLKQIRLKKHWTQKQLAEMSEVDLMTINRLEKGYNKPLDLTIQKLADALGVKPEEIDFSANDQKIPQ